MKIGTREIGGGAPCLVVGEVGLAHDGSLGMAHAYIDAVAAAGAGAVKFQHHRPEEPGEWRTAPEWKDETRAEYWRRTAFTKLEWTRLAEHAEAAGLTFLCSTFSPTGAEAMERLVPAWKVASGQVTNEPMLDYMGAHPKPTIISGGMCDDAEWTDAMARFPVGTGLVFLHSTSLYPTPLDMIGLPQRRAWPTSGEKAGIAAGLSDHSGTIWPSLAAATLGAAMVEVHVTFSRAAYGPDTASSITVAQLGTLCEGIEAIRLAQQPVDRAALLAGPLKAMREAYMPKVMA